jgi:hypothetical protein
MRSYPFLIILFPEVKFIDYCWKEAMPSYADVRVWMKIFVSVLENTSTFYKKLAIFLKKIKSFPSKDNGLL